MTADTTIRLPSAVLNRLHQIHGEVWKKPLQEPLYMTLRKGLDALEQEGEDA